MLPLTGENAAANRYEVGEDIPVFVSDANHPVFGTCLVTDAVPTCEAKHPSTSRLCPCAS